MSDLERVIFFAFEASGREALLLWCPEGGNAERVVVEECSRYATDLGMYPRQVPALDGLWVWEGVVAFVRVQMVGEADDFDVEWMTKGWRRPNVDELAMLGAQLPS